MASDRRAGDARGHARRPGVPRRPRAITRRCSRTTAIVHARDVALGVIRLVDVVDGMLLPGRPPARRAFVTALGVATAYLHDTGMVDMTRSGRRLHAIRAAQAAFGPDVDGLVAAPRSNPGRSASGWTRSTPRRRSPSRSSSWSASC